MLTNNINLKELNYKVAVCGLARDCKASLERNLPKLDELRSYFKDTAVVIVENDSVDGTKELLNTWANGSSNVHIISKDYGTDTIPVSTVSNPYPGTSIFRIAKMSSYRNVYMEWLDKNYNCHLMIVIDLDVEFFDVKDIIRSIVDAPANWGGIFANGYTDTKIFGQPVYTMFHDMYAYVDVLPAKMPYMTYGKLFHQKKMMNASLKKNRFLPVQSAFGGIGIYKYDLIKDQRYNAVANGDQFMESLCEHVLFNRIVVDKKFDLYIDAKLKVYYGKSNKLIVFRNIVPLWLFKLTCIIVRFRKLKE